MIGGQHQHERIGSVAGKGKGRKGDGRRGIARRGFQKNGGTYITFVQCGRYIKTVGLIADNDRLQAFRSTLRPQ